MCGHLTLSVSHIDTYIKALRNTQAQDLRLGETTLARESNHYGQFHGLQNVVRTRALNHF